MRRTGASLERTLVLLSPGDDLTPFHTRPYYGRGLSPLGAVLMSRCSGIRSRIVERDQPNGSVGGQRGVGGARGRRL